jgi:hypothetical protein
LTTEQYGELMFVVEASTTTAELCAALLAAADRWGNSVEIEEGTNGYVRAIPY